MEQIAMLLSHYWAANEDDALRRAQLRDWLNDLKDYPLQVVVDACSAWRRIEERKPTIAGIRKMCDERMPRDHSKPQLARPEDEYRDYNAQRTAQWNEAVEARERWAQEHGRVNFAQAMQIGISNVSRKQK